MSSPSTASNQPSGGEPSAASRIRAAAMKCFATQGTEATSLRMVADTAGVSIGLVQHHFGNKAALIKAVDDQLITIMSEAVPLPVPPPDPVADLGHRATSLIAEHPEAIDYLASIFRGDWCGLGLIPNCFAGW